MQSVLLQYNQKCLRWLFQVSKGRAMVIWHFNPLPYSRKFWRWNKFGGLAVWFETAKLKSTNIILSATHNDVMHAAVLLHGSIRHPSTGAVHIASSGLARCQLYGRQRSVINMPAMLQGVTAKFKFRQYFLHSVWCQTSKFIDGQYFWLYGNTENKNLIQRFPLAS